MAEPLEVREDPRWSVVVVAIFLLYQFGVPAYALVLRARTNQVLWPFGWQMFS